MLMINAMGHCIEDEALSLVIIFTWKMKIQTTKGEKLSSNIFVFSSSSKRHKHLDSTCVHKELICPLSGTWELLNTH